MSEEQLKAFLEKVRSDTSLQEKLQSAADSETVLAIAKDAGFLISTEELQKAQTMISDEELENVSGGLTPFAIGALNIANQQIIPQAIKNGVANSGKQETEIKFRIT